MLRTHSGRLSTLISYNARAAELLRAESVDLQWGCGRATSFSVLAREATMTPRILKVSMEYENKTKLFQRCNDCCASHLGFKKLFFYNCLYVCVCQSPTHGGMCVPEPHTWRSREHDILGGLCKKMSCVIWTQDLNSLEQQQVLLTTESFSSPLP